MTSPRVVASTVIFFCGGLSTKFILCGGQPMHPMRGRQCAFSLERLSCEGQCTPNPAYHSINMTYNFLLCLRNSTHCRKSRWVSQMQANVWKRPGATGFDARPLLLPINVNFDLKGSSIYWNVLNATGKGIPGETTQNVIVYIVIGH